MNADLHARPEGATWLRPEECRVGRLYALRSRNLTFGVFQGPPENGFIGIREKFGDRSLFVEYHRDTGRALGTVRPYVDLEPCPVLVLAEYLGRVCPECDEPVERRWGPEHHRPDPNPTLPEIRFSDYHLSDGTRLAFGFWPRPIPNTALFDYLREAEARYRSRWEDLVGSSPGL